MVRYPILESFAQEGTRPHRMGASARSTPFSARTTTLASWEGARLKRSGSSITPSREKRADRTSGATVRA